MVGPIRRPQGSGRDLATGQFVKGRSTPLSLGRSPRGRNTESFKAFSREMRAFANELTPKEALAFQKRIARDLMFYLVQQTPVDHGPARSNWILTTDKPSDKVYKAHTKSGKLSLERAEKALQKLKAYGVIHIVNNLPYIDVLEYGGFIPANPGPSRDPRPHRRGRIWVKEGFSVQAPNGMMGVSLERIRAKYK